jgi:hypothetical protein
MIYFVNSILNSISYQLLKLLHLMQIVFADGPKLDNNNNDFEPFFEPPPPPHPTHNLTKLYFGGLTMQYLL